jgi:hypothetical protein
MPPTLIACSSSCTAASPRAGAAAAYSWPRQLSACAVRGCKQRRARWRGRRRSGRWPRHRTQTPRLMRPPTGSRQTVPWPAPCQPLVRHVSKLQMRSLMLLGGPSLRVICITLHINLARTQLKNRCCIVS